MKTDKMKILLKNKEIFGGIKSVAPITIRGGRSRVQSEILVDNSSGWTIISEIDRQMMQIPLSGEKVKRPVDIASLSLILYRTRELVFVFESDKNKKVEIRFNPYVARLASPTLENKSTQYQLPTIIGTDFLFKNDISLIFSPKKEFSYLELEN